MNSCTCKIFSRCHRRLCLGVTPPREDKKKTPSVVPASLFPRWCKKREASDHTTSVDLNLIAARISETIAFWEHQQASFIGSQGIQIRFRLPTLVIDADGICTSMGMDSIEREREREREREGKLHQIPSWRSHHPQN